MKNVNIKQQFKKVISFFAIVLLLSMTSIAVLPIGKVHAMTSLPVVPNSINTTTSLEIAASPFYESNFGKLIGERVVNTANGFTPQMGYEYTTIENGTIKGVGNVTMLQTWTNAAPEASRSPRIIYGVGQGVINTADGQDMATWIGYGIGRSNINGTITFHGINFFNTNSTGKLAFLKNLEGLNISVVDGNKQITKIYEWK
ncbi:MAG TPA: hypothetical protein VJ729_11960 [Nitrososphaeraceae archaeon]|nr:hypothetical protein [Nitrososphaeraceae archaeon]